MTSSGGLRESLTWAGTVAAGAWLSIKVAHWLVDALAVSGTANCS